MLAKIDLPDLLFEVHFGRLCREAEPSPRSSL